MSVPLERLLYIQDRKNGGSLVVTDLPSDEGGKMRSFRAVETARELAEAYGAGTTKSSGRWLRRA